MANVHNYMCYILKPRVPTAVTKLNSRAFQGFSSAYKISSLIPSFFKESRASGNPGKPIYGCEICSVLLNLLHLFPFVFGLTFRTSEIEDR